MPATLVGIREFSLPGDNFHPAIKSLGATPGMIGWAVCPLFSVSVRIPRYDDGFASLLYQQVWIVDRIDHAVIARADTPRVITAL